MNYLALTERADPITLDNSFGVLSSIIVSNAQAVASLLQSGGPNQTRE